MHGKRRVFVFAGGESTPPTGGLMSIDQAIGRVDFSFPWLSRTVESVNASCPVIFENNKVKNRTDKTPTHLLKLSVKKS